MTLADKIEAAEGASRELFEAAFYACFPMPDFNPWWRLRFSNEEAVWDRRWQRFSCFIRCRAWLSAAEMLVPEGWQWHTGIEGYVRGGYAVLTNIATRTQIRCDHAATPALALCAASLRARAGEGV